jgi:tRNA G18 (ribose-2'-O)-methylase SpoU
VRVVPVDDPDDPRVTPYTRLTDHQLRSRMEEEHGWFVAEGVTVIRRLLAARPSALRSALVNPTKLADLSADLEPFDVDVHVAGQAVLDAIAGFPIHRGALALGARWPEPDLVGDPAVRRLVVLEDTNDHENLGAITRSAAALGADGVLLSPRCCDPLSRRALRVSVGGTLVVPWARAHDWPAAITTLQRNGFHVLALTPADDAVALHDVDPSAHERIAVLLGAEGPGLTAAAMRAADQRVRIPVTDGIDSLNVAAAAAIALHHVRPASLR